MSIMPGQLYWMSVGIDLARNVFAVHGVDEHDRNVLIKPSVVHNLLLPFILQMVPCQVHEQLSGSIDFMLRRSNKSPRHQNCWKRSPIGYIQ